MGRLTQKYLAEEATCTFNSWTGGEIVMFHFLNQNGAYYKWQQMCKTIDQHIEAGHIPNGWVLAYGSLSSYSADRLVELMGQRRVGATQLQVVLQMLDKDIDKGYTKLAEMIMEG